MFEIFYNRTLRFLSFRPRSEKEVRVYLSKIKNPAPVASEFIEKIIGKLTEKKFLDDSAFVEWWVEQRTRIKPKGWKIIALELKQKGISSELIKHYELKIVNEEGKERNEGELIQHILKKKIDKYKGLPRQKIYQKLGSFLIRQGFKYDTIRKAIDDILPKGYNMD